MRVGNTFFSHAVLLPVRVYYILAGTEASNEFITSLPSWEYVQKVSEAPLKGHVRRTEY